MCITIVFFLNATSSKFLKFHHIPPYFILFLSDHKQETCCPGFNLQKTSTGLYVALAKQLTMYDDYTILIYIAFPFFFFIPFLIKFE